MAEIATDSDAWILAGPTSSFLDVKEPTGLESLYQVTGAEDLNACKIFQASESPPVEVSAEDAATTTPEQILIFQYKGEFHAVQHQCPHLKAPLSRGKLSDIEDGAAIQCAKHARAFKLTTGENVKGGKLNLDVWETQVKGEELWIRKKQSS